MSTRQRTQYPFTPKSTASLAPGQFWGIPLSNGCFACGRVLQLMPQAETGSRVMFLAGLMNWCSPQPPDENSIAGTNCIEQGGAHIKAILNNGHQILGHRCLDLDGIEPWLFRGAESWINSHLQQGMVPIRKQLPADDRFPVFLTWGYSVISRLAEKHFVTH